MSKWTKKGRFSICCTIGGHKWEFVKEMAGDDNITYFKCWHCGAKQITTKPSEDYGYPKVDITWLLSDD